MEAGLIKASDYWTIWFITIPFNGEDKVLAPEATLPGFSMTRSGFARPG